MNDINKLSVAVFVMCMFSIVRQSSAEESARTNKLQQRWPQITELAVKVHFDTKKERKFKQIIRSASGDPLYVLDARMPSIDEHDRAYDYSGTFDCRLYPYDPKNWGEGMPSLLTNVRNSTQDWETDGRFIDSELLGLADFNGTRFLVQRSRLRGMSLTIEINNVKIKNVVITEDTSKIASFDACFWFRNDPLAISDIAAPPAESPNIK
jgi:hypothetical protein